MLFLDLLTILSIGLMTGVEFSVSAFIDPILLQLDEKAQAFAISLSAKKFGKIMPFWYIGNFLLLIAETVLRWHETAGSLLLIASIFWAAAIVLSIFFLVPINNRMMHVQLDGLKANERQQHRKWNSLHRLRIVALIIAMLLLLIAVR